MILFLLGQNKWHRPQQRWVAGETKKGRTARVAEKASVTEKRGKMRALSERERKQIGHEELKIVYNKDLGDHVSSDG